MRLLNSIVTEKVVGALDYDICPNFGKGPLFKRRIWRNQIVCHQWMFYESATIRRLKLALVTVENSQ